FVGDLIEAGHAYEANGDVWYSVESFPEYGKLSHRDLNSQLVAARKDLEPGKRDPRDFALWKAARPGEPSWPSPWGQGRPGWHIECSAMARATLGDTLDIHGGGSDLIFPHHENEIAQTEAARRKRLARIWMHNGMLQFDEEKMAKSVGNVRLLSDVIDEHGRDTLIALLTSAHYRKPLAFSDATVEQAEANVRKVRELGRRLAHSLVPIAAAYVIAHYFSLLAYEGQRISYLISDPLGDGSNIFGTSSATVDYTWISATAIWYVQVAALVIGHVAGLVLAHERALVSFDGDSQAATRSQYWMLVVMIAFTSLGLWLLSAANS
ncbi:MAG: hypothetical protein KY463_01560, partial [Actinobacteria bacterium]|nr:hypothetical protein [Actinomycetota bacterium]